MHAGHIAHLRLSWEQIGACSWLMHLPLPAAVPTSPTPRASTQLMLPGLVGHFHHIQLQALVALPDAVDAGDVGALFVHLLHQLGGEYSMVRGMGGADPGLRPHRPWKDFKSLQGPIRWGHHGAVQEGAAATEGTVRIREAPKQGKS